MLVIPIPSPIYSPNSQDRTTGKINHFNAMGIFLNKQKMLYIVPKLFLVLPILSRPINIIIIPPTFIELHGVV